jgi:N-acetylglucosamine-6-phosphate deacetylase
MAESGLERGRRQGVTADQALDEGQVAEVAEQRSVAGEEQLRWLLAAEVACVHLPLEEGARALELGAQRSAEVHAQASPTLERLSSDESDEVGVLHEELEARREDVIDERPSVAVRLVHRGDLDPLVPLGERQFEDLAVDGVLRREVVQEARSANAHPGGDVVERGAVEPVVGEASPPLDEDLLASGGRNIGVSKGADRGSSAVPRGGDVGVHHLAHAFEGSDRATLLAVAEPFTVAASRVLWPDGTLAPGVITVLEGRISGVARPEVAVHDRILCPGFVDLQVNGVDDVDVATAEGSDWARLDDALLAQGVTTWCPTLITAPWDALVAAAARIRDAARRPGLRPHIAGVHLEGPWLGAAVGAHPVEHVLTPDAESVGAIPDGVVLVTLGPDAPGAADACRALVDQGIAVAIGHTRASYEQAAVLVDAGATVVTHLGNAMGPLMARDPGVFGLGLADDRLAIGVIADLVHVHPAVLRIASRAAGRRMVLVTDAVAWRSDSHVRRGIGHYDGAPRLADGTLAGSSLSMDAAVRNLVGCGAADVATALRAASTNPADVLGLSDRGAIRVGAVADLVALDAELQVETVWLGGHPI